MFDEMGEKEPHPRPLSEERGEQLALEMEEVVLRVIIGGAIVDIKSQNDLTQMSA